MDIDIKDLFGKVDETSNAQTILEHSAGDSISKGGAEKQ